MTNECRVHNCIKCDCKEPGYRDNATPPPMPEPKKFKVANEAGLIVFSAVVLLCVVVGIVCITSVCITSLISEQNAKEAAEAAETEHKHQVLTHPPFTVDEQNAWKLEYERATREIYHQGDRCLDTPREAADWLILNRRLADIKLKERMEGKP
jgi:hypothetical protein